jgi:hypothetical protein
MEMPLVSSPWSVIADTPASVQRSASDGVPSWPWMVPQMTPAELMLCAKLQTCCSGSPGMLNSGSGSSSSLRFTQRHAW